MAASAGTRIAVMEFLTGPSSFPSGQKTRGVPRRTRDAAAPRSVVGRGCSGQAAWAAAGREQLGTRVSWPQCTATEKPYRLRCLRSHVRNEQRGGASGTLSVMHIAILSSLLPDPGSPPARPRTSSSTSSSRTSMTSASRCATAYTPAGPEECVMRSHFPRPITRAAAG